MKTGLQVECQVLGRVVRNANHTVVLMLLSLATLNMPQAAVFCIGDDGHMAIEPAGHDHCADGSHPRNYRPTGIEAAAHSHIGSPQGRPCVDIPIPAESSDHRFASQKSKLVPTQAAGLAAAVETPWTVDLLCSFEPAFFPPSVSRDASPLCVVLQV
ncbi:MAG: hypothetical protein ABFE01_00875 [Phycisphaerales bacterium]